MTPTEQLADFVTLVYHEARNVRHLIKDGYVPAIAWTKLINMPVNRYAAWRMLQPLRSEAGMSNSAQEVLVVFERRFDVTLVQLIALYQNPNWKCAEDYGGHAWIPIAEAVWDLARAIDDGHVESANRIVQSLINAQHNTGRLMDKLQDLDQNA